MNIIRTTKQRVKYALDNRIGKEEYCLNDISDKTKVVSFDVFDTLIVRDVNKPTDVFRIMEEILGIPGFYEKRIEAERIARINKQDTTEVTIDDIYQAYEGISSEKINEYIEKELQTEISICHPNLDIISLYEQCKEKYKVIIVSDMYLPADMMEKLLNSCSITGYEKIYVSCDVEKSKYKGGELFDSIADDLGICTDEITHIGDDFKSDYMNARKKRIQTMKIRKQKTNRLISRYKLPSYKNYEQFDIIYNYINNTTPRDKEFYYRFGYENFGVLLGGFCKWLLDRMTKEGIEQALFIARDGYIIKEVYDMMGYSEIIPSKYFEVSRRSVIVASSLSKDLTYIEMLDVLRLPARISIGQLFDAWGLEVSKYRSKIELYEIGVDEVFALSELSHNDRLNKLYEDIKNDIRINAESEYKFFLEYLDMFDFYNTALVDIGWAGTIQRELQKTLKEEKRICKIKGYYLALDKSANRNGKTINAEGYLWDHYNQESNENEEGPFFGLFETLFLEQAGSVKRYVKKDNHITAERYPYEYLSSGGIIDEISCVKTIQEGTLEFINRIKGKYIDDIVELDSEKTFAFMRKCLMEPSKEMVDRFGQFRFFDTGDYTYLAYPKMTIAGYIICPRRLINDFYESAWPIGFFKALIKFNISYERLWDILKSIKNTVWIKS